MERSVSAPQPITVYTPALYIHLAEELARKGKGFPAGLPSDQQAVCVWWGSEVEVVWWKGTDQALQKWKLLLLSGKFPATLVKNLISALIYFQLSRN